MGLRQTHRAHPAHFEHGRKIARLLVLAALDHDEVGRRSGQRRIGDERRVGPGEHGRQRTGHRVGRLETAHFIGKSDGRKARVAVRIDRFPHGRRHLDLAVDDFRWMLVHRSGTGLKFFLRDLLGDVQHRGDAVVVMVGEVVVREELVESPHLEQHEVQVTAAVDVGHGSILDESIADSSSAAEPA